MNTFTQPYAVRWDRHDPVRTSQIIFTKWHWQQPDSLHTECGRESPQGNHAQVAFDASKVDCRLCHKSPSCQAALNQLTQKEQS